jgi:Rap1a immunity proteins
MHRNVPPAATRTAAAVLMAAALGLASLANAQTPAQPMAKTLSQAAPPVDPTFSAYSLVQSCKQRHDNVAQGQCVGAIRGIIHGYQYGVLFLAQRATLPANEMQRVSLCLRDVPVSTIVDDFLADAAQVPDDALQHTPAEVAVLGSVHQHHACT